MFTHNYFVMVHLNMATWTMFSEWYYEELYALCWPYSCDWPVVWPHGVYTSSIAFYSHCVEASQLTIDFFKSIKTPEALELVRDPTTYHSISPFWNDPAKLIGTFDGMSTIFKGRVNTYPKLILDHHQRYNNMGAKMIWNFLNQSYIHWDVYTTLWSTWYTYSKEDMLLLKMSYENDSLFTLYLDCLNKKGQIHTPYQYDFHIKKWWELKRLQDHFEFQDPRHLMHEDQKKDIYLTTNYYFNQIRDFTSRPTGVFWLYYESQNFVEVYLFELFHFWWDFKAQQYYWSVTHELYDRVIQTPNFLEKMAKLGQIWPSNYREIYPSENTEVASVLISEIIAQKSNVGVDMHSEVNDIYENLAKQMK